jgi:hypothetical protein
MDVSTGDTSAGRRPFLTGGLAALAAALSVTLYLSAGATSAYLAADDFQWLQSGQTFDWRSLSPGGRDHFYRPVTSLWFASAARLCGESAPCLHGLNIALHGVNVLIVFALVLMLSRSRGLACVVAMMFGVLPAYTQAIVWVSAVTALLATFGVLVSLVCQVHAWRAPTPARRRAFTLAAIAAGGFAVFAHEAAATLPILSAILAGTFAPRPIGWRPLAAGLTLVIAVFALTAYLANRENYVFREGHYAIGPHMLPHLADYLVSLWVGPHVGWAYVLTLVALGAAALAGPLARTGILWMVVSLLPYVGFTWGNVSRYAYLPAVGMAMTLGAVAIAAIGASRARTTRIMATAIAALAIARFALFTLKGVSGDSRAFEPIRDYVHHVQSLGKTPTNGVLEVPAPTSEHVDPRYFEPMFRWLYGDPHLTVVVR